MFLVIFSVRSDLVSLFLNSQLVFQWLLFLFLLLYEFDFLGCPVRLNSCPVVFHILSLVIRFVDKLFVPDTSDFSNFRYLDKDSLGVGIYPESFFELNYTSNGFCCNFLDLAISKDSKSIDIFKECSQLEYADINMICMPCGIQYFMLPRTQLLHLCMASLCFWHRCLLVQGQAKLIPSQS